VAVFAADVERVHKELKVAQLALVRFLRNRPAAAVYQRTPHTTAVQFA
jgi:hypothetical protein